MSEPARRAQTYLPERAHHSALIELADLLQQTQHATGTPDASLLTTLGRRPIPHEIIEILLTVAEAMARGLAVTVMPLHPTLTTQQAADLLGISRPTLIGLLEQGQIPYHRPGRHRRIQLADLLDYQRRTREQQATALDEMVERAEATGLYDLDPTDVQQALHQARQRRVPSPRAVPGTGG